MTFFYNGGPGSSTVWLHMGSLAPVRVLTDSPKPTHNAPYQLVNNDASLLDKSDLVFLDAMGAGFSRPLGDTKLAAFWGTDQDIDAFARGDRALADHQRAAGTRRSSCSAKATAPPARPACRIVCSRTGCS